MTAERRRPASLRDRLAVAFGAVAVGSVLVSSLVAVGLVRGEAQRSAQAELERLARALTTELAGGGLPGDRELRVPRRLLRVSGARLALVAVDGSLLGGDAGFAAGIDVRPLLAGEQIRGTVSFGDDELAYIGYPTARRAVPVRAADLVAGVVLARPVTVAGDAWRPVAMRLLLAATAALVAAGVFSVVLSRRLARPLRQVAEGTRRVAAGDLAQRVPVTSDDEIGELAASFNAMAEALAEAQRREREFLENVSHELRTPLTAVRGYVEALQEGAVAGEKERSEALEVVRSETARLERMVQDVLDLARLGAKEFRLDLREADVAGAIRAAGAAHAARAAAAGVRLEIDVPSSIRVRTDPDRVQQVIGNLVENAMRVTPAGGEIRVAAGLEDGWVAVTVADDGPGIAAEHLPHVFERSYLWRAVRGEREVGTGLGLAIVRGLVGALGGTIAVTSEAGGGTRFRVLLPLA